MQPLEVFKPEICNNEDEVSHSIVEVTSTKRRIALRVARKMHRVTGPLFFEQLISSAFL